MSASGLVRLLLHFKFMDQITNAYYNLADETVKRETVYSLIRKYIGPRLNLEKTKLKDTHKAKVNAHSSKEKRNFEKTIAEYEDFIEEVGAFKQNIQEVIDTGFVPDIDDGVILNMAPLYKLIPWSEPQKFYQELTKGKYEWAHVSKYFKK